MARGIARDHAEKRAAIRKGAAEYFATHGFDRASMAGAAAHCGVSKALLYHYYGSKNDLLFDILDTHLSELLQVVEAVTPGPERLRRLIHAILTNYRNADAEHMLQADALDKLPAERRRPLVEVQRRIVRVMEQVLAETASGQITNPARHRALAMAVFGMLNWFYMWHRPGKGVSRKEYGDLVADLVLGGLPGLLENTGKNPP